MSQPDSDNSKISQASGADDSSGENSAIPDLTMESTTEKASTVKSIEAIEAIEAIEKVPTVDGTRVEFNEINVGTPGQEANTVSGSWLRRARARLSLFLAGMYTGIGCSGVPHSHHTYGPDKDNRPI